MLVVVNLPSNTIDLYESKEDPSIIEYNCFFDLIMNYINYKHQEFDKQFIILKNSNVRK